MVTRPTPIHFGSSAAREQQFLVKASPQTATATPAPASTDAAAEAASLTLISLTTVPSTKTKSMNFYGTDFFNSKLDVTSANVIPSDPPPP